MRKLLTITLAGLALASPLAFAKTECTTADKAQWQDQAKFQEDLKAQGYEIKKFKVTGGNCYEIYGFDKDKRKVEIYFDPVSGKAVKTELED
ncbi:MAG: PepSY domain-containing protein [Pseudomonas sp.]